MSIFDKHGVHTDAIAMAEGFELAAALETLPGPTQSIYTLAAYHERMFAESLELLSRIVADWDRGKPHVAVDVIARARELVR